MGEGCGRFVRSRSGSDHGCQLTPPASSGLSSGLASEPDAEVGSVDRWCARRLETVESFLGAVEGRRRGFDPVEDVALGMQDAFDVGEVGVEAVEASSGVGVRGQPRCPVALPVL